MKITIYIAYLLLSGLNGFVCGSLGVLWAFLFCQLILVVLYAISLYIIAEHDNKTQP